ncbi:MAG: hypothetical protein ACREJM_14520 [Candidatus Saccharimonadales bacterium]
MTVASTGELQAFYDAALRRERALHGAAPTTIEALMLSLRERGTRALAEPPVRERLAELSRQQVIEVAVRLQKLNPRIARPWIADDVEKLFQVRKWLTN